MDINTLRSVLTALALGCFLAIAFWAYSKGARKGFDEAALLPFSDDDGLPEKREPVDNRG
ncbi:MAG: CcoQ/FixQ family Cbb3-type cytochrome c oxidase assembly chaperone [Uliginosibacterium sp.]|jgi:cytochrome c oxidase cbb3-type subunit 4|nr:CcoQ/FixQ family Cbb3-type cytochrome c oxidase assembly chaperone [Uliginosibacterium sp.]MBK9392431.1 CcoQ/FixQ family Cbb3-type cytochrome c oxidase assembly chaperone [Uliginosibacterium sp.]MBK9615510.1 CcoQ/FixQ family Cbb3-type cytochrome c oxidase assembly chaperone [Uliginosibacterium sp.]